MSQLSNRLSPHDLGDSHYFNRLHHFSRQMTSIRASLASSVLQAVELCLEMSTPGQTVGSVFPSIRSALTTSHIIKFVDLGSVLHSVLLRSRSWEPSENGDVGLSALDFFYYNGEATSWSFSSEEKSLWYVSSNFACCARVDVKLTDPVLRCLPLTFYQGKPL